MLKRFYPKFYCESTYRINFEQLYTDGYRGVIFDIDNTLVPHDAPADARAEALFSHLKELGFSCMLLSNNRASRVEEFNKNIGVDYIEKASKPKPGKYIEAMERMGTNKQNTIFVGDQIFTDILGANNAGIPAIMVRWIDPHEEIQIVLKRKLEALVLLGYRRFYNHSSSRDVNSPKYWKHRYELES